MASSAEKPPKTTGKVKKADLLNQAELLFQKKGYLGTSMRDLAKVMNVEAASLYSHFPSKTEILWQIADRCANEFFHTVKPIYLSKLNTKAKLKEMIIAHIKVITSNLNASAVFMTEWKHLPPEKYQVYALMRDYYEQMFRKVILDGVRENLFRNVDEKFSSLTILSALNWTHQWYRPNGEMTPEQIGEHLAEILLNGLIRTV